MQEDKNYPEGTGTGFFSRRVDGLLKFFRRSDATEFYSIDGANKRVIIADTVKQIRARFTVAQVNAGATVLPALPGYKYRMVDAAAIAVGGAATGATGVDLTATLAAASRKLVAFKVAGLTQSTLLRAGTATNGILLADGASHTANDANTAVTVIKDGSDVATATHIDILLSYVVEAA
jgi:hypothetical protein